MRTGSTRSLDRPVLGFRAWRLFSNGELRALRPEPVFTWPAGDVWAECLPWKTSACQGSPGADCVCGIYAWHHPSRAYARTADRSITGAVLAWGEIEVTEHGFRAEWARPVALSLPDGWPPDIRAARRCADLYGATLSHKGHFPSAAAEHGAPVPAEERPIEPLLELVSHLSSARFGELDWDTAIRIHSQTDADNPEADALFALAADLVLREARARTGSEASLAGLLHAGAGGLLHACDSHGRDPASFRPVAAWWIARAMDQLATPAFSTVMSRGVTLRELRAALGGAQPTDRELADLERSSRPPDDRRLSAAEYRTLREELSAVDGAYLPERDALVRFHLDAWAARSERDRPEQDREVRQ